jgi:phosphatidylserine/phosphatidylglycerophosphate/cardiolipin synthase-like enzyme
VQGTIERITSEPILGGHRVRLPADGTEHYVEMLSLVASARRDLQFENFIFRSDVVGRVFADRLARDEERLRWISPPVQPASVMLVP